MANIKKVANLSVTRSGTFIADVPDTPTIGTATDVGTSRAFNNGAATVAINSTTGGTPTSYTVTSSPGGFSANGTSPVTVTGLQSETSYTFTATATGGGYTTGSSSSSNSITATTVPQTMSAPTGTNVPSGRAYNNGRADVTFTAPSSNGGKAITGYTVTSSPGSYTGTGSSSPISVTGLQSNTSYTFTVTSTNANGTSQSSAASASVGISTVPQEPTISVSLSYPNFSMTFTGASGGNTITGYEYSTNGGTNWKALAGTTSPQTISTQSNNSAFVAATSYPFTLRAINANGTSLTSNSVNATYAGPPGIPGSITAANTYSQSNFSTYTKVSWTAPSNNGASITGYTVTASPGGASSTVSGAATSTTFTSLTPGTSYTFSVYATNVAGNGTAGNSNSIYAIDLGYNAGSFGVSTTSATYSNVFSQSATNITNTGESSFLWRGIALADTVSSDVLSRFVTGPEAATSALQTFNTEAQDTTDIVSVGGLVHLSSGISSSDVFRIQVASESTAQISTLDGTALLRTRLGTGSVAARQTTNMTNASTNPTRAVTVLFPSTGNYLVIGSAEINVNNTAATASQIRLSTFQSFGTGAPVGTYGAQTPVPTVDTTNYTPYFHIEKVTVTANTLIAAVEFLSGNTSYTATCRNASILLINLDNAGPHYYHAPVDATNTGLGTISGGTATFSIANSGNVHLLIGSAMLNSGSTTLSASAKLAQGGTRTVQRESNTTTEEYPMIAFTLMPGTTSTYYWEFGGESTNTVTISNQRIFLLDTGIPNAELPAFPV